MNEMATEQRNKRLLEKAGVTADKQKFESGAVRDVAESKPRPDLISPFAEERLGEWLRLGAEKYDTRNWEQGIPNSRHFESLERHVMYFNQGRKDEDHLSAILFNAMAIIHNQEMIKRGVLSASLDDMPVYEATNDKQSNESKDTAVTS